LNDESCPHPRSWRGGKRNRRTKNVSGRVPKIEGGEKQGRGISNQIKNGEKGTFENKRNSGAKNPSGACRVPQDIKSLA